MLIRNVEKFMVKPVIRPLSKKIKRIDDFVAPALVFTRTKHGADKVVKILEKHNIKAEAIHGVNMEQQFLDLYMMLVDQSKFLSKKVN